MVCNLHRILGSIVSDPDPIFTSKFWQPLFKLRGTILTVISSQHPQTDGQTEVVNKGLQQYPSVFCMIILTNGEDISIGQNGVITPRNTLPPLLHLKMVYRTPPLSISQYIPGTSNLEAIEYDLTNRYRMLQELKQKLSKAQFRNELMLGGRTWNLKEI